MLQTIPPCNSEENCMRLGSIDIIHAAEHWFNFHPHPAQQKIIFNQDKITTVACGRRFGKTELASILCLHHALTNKDKVQLCVAPTQAQSRIIFDNICNYATKSPIISKYVVGIKSFPFPEIEFESGHTIYARTVGRDDGENLRGLGKGLSRMTLDESSYIKDRVKVNVLNPMLADLDAPLFEISTPLARYGMFFENFSRGQNGEEGFSSFQFSSFSNPHISHDFIRKQKLIMPEVQYLCEYEAQFIDESIMVFTSQSIENALEQFEEAFSPIKGHQYYMGVDIAKVHDFSALCILDGTDPQCVKIVYTERFTHRPFDYLIKRILSLASSFQVVRINIDETGVGAGISEQVMMTCPVAEGFVFSMPSKISLINTFKTGLEQGRIKISENNYDLINELKYYQFEQTDAGNLKMNAAPGKFDDLCIAACLAYQKCAVTYADAAIIPIDYKPTKDLYNSEQSIAIVINNESMSDPFISRDWLADRPEGIRRWNLTSQI